MSDEPITGHIRCANCAFREKDICTRIHNLTRAAKTLAGPLFITPDFGCVLFMEKESGKR